MRMLPVFAFLVAQLNAQDSLSLQEAIRLSWQNQGMQAGEAMVDGARAQAQALAQLRLPSLSVEAGFTRTDEPMMAFGTRLDQARIAQSDFLPSRLNHPDPVTSSGAFLHLSQPLYAGGRLDAARKAGVAMAEAEAAFQAHRRQQMALAVLQAYFGAQLAEQALLFSEDTLAQARETERFVSARVEQGLLLSAEGERAKTFRLQSEAGVLEARQGLASARSALRLLTGSRVETLSTPLMGPTSDRSTPSGLRGDLQALSFQVQAAQEGVKASKGKLLPEVGLKLSAGTARFAFNGGGSWTTASLGAKWNLDFGDRHRIRSAQAQARAAELNLKWQNAQAEREAEEARRALETARSRSDFAQQAVIASESVRAVRKARHREGLLPLLEVLDAESALSGARTLLLQSAYEQRLSRAQLALASGAPIEALSEKP